MNVAFANTCTAPLDEIILQDRRTFLVRKEGYGGSRSFQNADVATHNRTNDSRCCLFISKNGAAHGFAITRDRCYDFLNIFAEKFSKKNWRF
jgi:hypothetical protein